MGPFFVVVPTPILHFLLSVCKAQEPVSIEALRPEAPIECFDERIVGRFSRPREVERNAALIGPQAEITRDELSALIDPDRRRESHFIADPFQYIHDVGAAEGEPWLQRRREAGEDVDDREDPKLAAGRQLIVDEVHRPGLVRSRRRSTVIPQLGLDPTLRRFVAQLEAQFAVDAACLVLAVMPALATQNDMNAAIAVANANMADLLDPLFESSLTGATRFVMVGRPVKLKSLAGSADRHLPLAAHLVDELALPARLHSFRRITSCSISLSSERVSTRGGPRDCYVRA